MVLVNVIRREKSEAVRTVLEMNVKGRGRERLNTDG